MALRETEYLTHSKRALDLIHQIDKDIEAIFHKHPDYTPDEIVYAIVSSATMMESKYILTRVSLLRKYKREGK